MVECDDGRTLQCKIKGKFRIKGIRTTNPVSVGDEVEVAMNVDGTAFIHSILPRRNYIIRRSTNLSKESHILASNIDQAMLVVSLANPVTNTTFIDRFLATAEAYSVPAVMVINKCDLLTEGDDVEYLKAFTTLDESIGYKVIAVSALKGEGIEGLKETLAGKTTLLSGNSGVGKSSLINALVPGAGLKTGDVSASHHTGMHTTTFSEMFKLPFGGCIIDTPGVKGFGTIDFNKAEVAHYFPEIFKISADCRYNNCTHTHEPGCAVLQAVEEHFVSESRYASYLSIISDDPNDRYREAF